MKAIEVLFTPAEYAFLDQRAQLSETVCVVFDVLRMTSTIVTAVANGAESIMPVGDIADAWAEKNKRPEVLLAGERGGDRIENFEFGNSPREFTKRKVAGKALVLTTTNGTRALLACASAKKVLIASFLNLSATADFLLKDPPSRLLIVCSGTFDQAAYEDALGAGALCDLLWSRYENGEIADSALIACHNYGKEKTNLAAAIEKSRNAKRLLKQRNLRADVAFCSQRDKFKIVVKLGKDGMIRRRA
jgi:2-phosphosulfolactate phosphatase